MVLHGKVELWRFAPARDHNIGLGVGPDRRRFVGDVGNEKHELAELPLKSRELLAANLQLGCELPRLLTEILLLLGGRCPELIGESATLRGQLLRLVARRADLGIERQQFVEVKNDVLDLYCPTNDIGVLANELQVEHLTVASIGISFSVPLPSAALRTCSRPRSANPASPFPEGKDGTLGPCYFAL